jgi:hypothetical protein
MKGENKQILAFYRVVIKAFYRVVIKGRVLTNEWKQDSNMKVHDVSFIKLRFWLILTK